jgi:hypothetical protein
VPELLVEFNTIDASLDVTSTAAPAPSYDVPGYISTSNGARTVLLLKWHELTFSFSGRPTAERNNILIFTQVLTHKVRIDACIVYTLLSDH